MQLPHLLLAAGLGLAILYGSHVNAANNRRNCAAQVYALRVILQEIKPAPDADAGLRATIDDLNADYQAQYWRIYDFIQGDECVDLLPPDAPPSPGGQRPKP